ncbi:MAG: hypothetical protein EOO01_31235 [Chitinophagaceae bacterium]|nr:MAG: hypothetical protein EOO01_31235 [Chitinophagaceae bacterium]
MLINLAFKMPAMNQISEIAHTVNRELATGNSSTRLLKMNGSSMVADGIKDGDILIVEENFKEVNGKIILARLEGMLLVRRMELQGRRMRLLSGGNYFAPLEVDPYADFKILGIVQFVMHPL